MERIIRSVCQGSHCQCGVLVHVENGRVTKVEGDPNHPMNRGFICVKGRAQPELLYHPDRLKYPLRRAGERGGGKWERTTWDEALNAIAEKLTEIKEKYGPESIAIICGTGPRTGNTATHLLGLPLGTPNTISDDRHICYTPSQVAESCTIGERSTIMMEVGPDYRAANCIVVWGGNPLASHPPRGREIVEAKRRRKAKLIVIDPRRTTLASLADLWLQVRPGTDVALALGMMNVIIDEELYDKEFVGKWCYGFDKLKEHVKDYPPEKVAEITWISADKIRETARLYATTKPAVLHHRVAVEHNINSTQTDRAFVMLIALTGNIDVKGGNLIRLLPKGAAPVGSPSRGSREFEEKRIGSKEFPLISGPDSLRPFVHAPLAIEAMMTGKPYPIKALYCAAGNPVVNMQDGKRVWEALKNLELHVVAEFFMTPTAELADYVLPASTWLEKDEIGDPSQIMYTNYLAAGQKVIEPLFECWDDRKIVIELVKRIPWADRKFLPWNDVDELNESSVKGMGITFKELQKRGYIVEPMKYKKYEKNGFNTPTGKVELYSTIFEKHGYDPLPAFREPPESPVSTPELMKEYPLILITGGRNIAYFHTEGRQIPRLRKLVPDPVVEIHPDTAKEVNIMDGDWVWIETPQVKGERVKLKARLTPDIHPRIVHAAHGWWFPEKPDPEHGCFDSNISVLLSGDPPREPICGSVRTRG
ncbi:MAG: molybdopterin-dependent oxidoreductase, partial [Candidatus Bathyarchaeota archaeon]